MKRRPKPPSPSSRPVAASTGSSGGVNLTPTSLAIVGGVFVLGIGLGIGFSAATSAGTGSVVTLNEIDRAAPSADVCVQFGASAIAMDVRAFVTLNPFSVYVAQPKMQPGCVLRNSNWEVLRQRNLITSEQIRDCKNRMNTFGFIGPLDGATAPQINCIYQNDAAQNLFLRQVPGSGGPPPESDRF